MSKSNVNPAHYKVAGRERQGEDILQARNKQKHAESLVRRRTEFEAGLHQQAPARGPATPAATPMAAAKKATRKANAPHARTPQIKAARVTGRRPTSAAAPGTKARQATKKVRVNLQQADERGKRPTTRKRAK